MSKLNLNLKLKTSLKKKIEDENSQRGGSDARFLNYYDLKVNEKMKVLFLPDINGEAWAKFRKHGPNMKTRGIKSVRCTYEATGDTCAACERGFEFHNMAKENGDDKELKAESKKWFSKDYTVMSVLVLDSPFEVAVSPDKNEVKLLLVPFGMEKQIREAIAEGIVDEEELFSTPFYIKKTTNQGGNADYSSSYFARQQVSDDELSYFEDRHVQQYDYENLDYIPAPISSKEMEEWVANANKILYGEDGDSDEEEETRPTRREERAPVRREAPPRRRDEDDEEEAPQRPAPRRQVEEEEEEDVDPAPRRPAPHVEEEEEEQAPAPKRPSIRDRINRAS